MLQPFGETVFVIFFPFLEGETEARGNSFNTLNEERNSLSARRGNCLQVPLLDICLGSRLADLSPGLLEKRTGEGWQAAERGWLGGRLHVPWLLWQGCLSSSWSGAHCKFRAVGFDALTGFPPKRVAHWVRKQSEESHFQLQPALQGGGDI